MAAAHLAMSVGAEIFATAGSPQKRAFLKSLGIRHVMDSRTLEFADEVMAQTHGEGLDMVLNSLTDEFIPKSLALLRQWPVLEIGKSQILTPQQAAAVNPNATYIAIDLAEKLIDQPQVHSAHVSGSHGAFGPRDSGTHANQSLFVRTSAGCFSPYGIGKAYRQDCDLPARQS